MKIGIIIQTKELEKAWNAMRFAAQHNAGLSADGGMGGDRILTF